MKVLQLCILFFKLGSVIHSVPDDTKIVTNQIPIQIFQREIGISYLVECVIRLVLVALILIDHFR